jgi:hypothetical protein
MRLRQPQHRRSGRVDASGPAEAGKEREGGAPMTLRVERRRCDSCGAGVSSYAKPVRVAANVAVDLCCGCTREELQRLVDRLAGLERMAWAMDVEKG